jgi:type VI secretion system protein ImpG
MIEKYYEEELRYLYESGKEFARAHPDRAQFLNIDAVGDRDPYVERLFEGFAFLAARIREKLDDSFPELTEGLLDILWPQLLQEIPSLAIVELRPRKGMLSETRSLPRGTEILSSPAGPESVICRFTTTQDTKLHPLSLVTVEKSSDTRGRGSLLFRFEIDQAVQWRKLSLSPLRMFLYAELPTALMLHEFLVGHAQAVRLSINNGMFARDLDPADVIRPAGLASEESLLPADSRSFRGYSLLREYFVYPEKFLFVDLRGFEQAGPEIQDVKTVDFSVTFDRDFPPDKPFRADAFKLYCTPVANIFRKETEPVLYTGLQPEYPVLADVSYPRSVQAHTVLSVTGIDRETGRQTVYEPFHSFSVIGKKKVRSYAAHYRRSVDGRRQVAVSIGGDQLTGGDIREESLSIEAFCTNGTIPRDDLREGSISKPGPGFPEWLSASNITRPTLPCPPPEQDEFQWMFLSHLSSNYSTLASADTLKTILRLYDWSQAEGKARRINAISQVTQIPVESTRGGSVLRGIEFTVHLQESEFKDTGDLHLFGEILKEFLAQYVSINSFIELVLLLQPSGVVRRFSSLKGTQWPL